MREVEADLGIPKTTMSDTLMQDLGMKHVMGKFIPWLLLPEQKEHHSALANDLTQTTTNEPDFFKKAITRDESQIYGYETEMKTRLSQWKSPGSPCPQKVRQCRSKIKTMTTVFFVWETVVHHKYAPPGQIINKDYYLIVLHWLRDAI